MTNELTIETLDSVFKRKESISVSEKDLKKFKVDKKCFEHKLFTLAHYLGKRDKEIELAKLSNQKEEAKMLKFHGVTVHKNTNCSTYYARFRVGKKQYYVSAYTQKECYEKLKELKSPKSVAKLLAAQEVVTNDISLEDWYNRWLQLYKVGKVKDETIRSYHTLFKTIPQAMKEKRIADIKLVDLLSLIQNLTSERQQQKFHDLLSMVFQKAEDNDIIAKNLMRRVDKPKHKKEHSIALTSEQQNILIETCSKIENAEVILVALYQGFRRGEVLGITRDCVDFDKKKITINKSWSQRNKFDTTKNDQSVRTIPMFESTYSILLKHKEKKPEERMFNLSIKQYETILSKVRKESGLADLKMKDMRSTFITNCMNMNFPVHIIQAWVGHALGSVVTTSVYTSHNDEADIEYISRINDKFKNSRD